MKDRRESSWKPASAICDNKEQTRTGPRPGKRKLILDTALKLFMEKGYLETKIIDISSAAQIGKGTIYEYFSSKETLFAELLQIHATDRYALMKEEIAKDKASCCEQLRRYILFDSNMAKRFGNGKNFIDRLSFESELFQHPDLKEIINQLFEYRFSTLQSIIVKGIENREFRSVDPLMATLALLGAISLSISYRFGLFSSEHTESGLQLPEASGHVSHEDELLGILLQGLLPEKPNPTKPVT